MTDVKLHIDRDGHLWRSFYAEGIVERQFQRCLTFDSFCSKPLTWSQPCDGRNRQFFEVTRELLEDPGQAYRVPLFVLRDGS